MNIASKFQKRGKCCSLQEFQLLCRHILEKREKFCSDWLFSQRSKSLLRQTAVGRASVPVTSTLKVHNRCSRGNISLLIMASEEWKKHCIPGQLQNKEGPGAINSIESSAQGEMPSRRGRLFSTDPLRDGPTPTPLRYCKDFIIQPIIPFKIIWAGRTHRTDAESCYCAPLGKKPHKWDLVNISMVSFRP